jgi:hypothetical protein
MKRRLHFNVCTAAIIAPLAGCGGDGARATEGLASSDTIVAQPLALIGEVDGPADYTFGDITSLVVDPLGRIYVADRQGSTVRAFDSSGAFLALIGGEGQGPGEFARPNDLTLDPHGLLYVRDPYRITIFAPRASGTLPDSVVRTIRHTGGNASTRSATDGSVYYYPSGRWGDDYEYFYVVIDTAGPSGDTAFVPRFPTMAFLAPAIARFGVDALLLNGVNRAPFEPAASWDITRQGAVLASPGDRYELVEVARSGDTLRTIRLDADARAVPDNEARDSARAFQVRIEAVPVSLDEAERMSELAREGRLPAYLPTILAVHAAEGQTWIRRWPRSSDESLFDVLDPEGALLHTVVVPAPLLMDPPPFVSSTVVAGVVRDPITEGEQVASFAVPAR